MAAKTKRKQAYLKRRRKRAAITVLVIVIILAALYLFGAYMYRDRFMMGTLINGVNVSNMELADAVKAVEKTSDDYSLTLQFREDQTETIGADEIDFHYNEKQIGDALANQNVLTWIVGYIPGHSLEGAAEAAFDNAKLTDVIRDLPETDPESMKEPKDAYRTWKKGKFAIVPEELGTSLDPEAVVRAARDACSQAAAQVDLTKEKGVYSSPEVYADDARLNREVDSLNGLGLGSVTYQVPSGQDVKVDGETWIEWLAQAEDGSYSINQEKWDEAVSAFVTSLAEDVDTVYSSHEFKTHSGNVISVAGVGYYGYKVSGDEEAAQLKEDLKSGKEVKREPVYRKREAADRDDNYGFGQNYVEVNLSAQHLWVYRNGSVAVDSDLVSGKDDSKHRTPAGAYFAYDKQKDKTMRGDVQADGSYGYTSHANYWIRLTGEGVGLHDATWRSSFGGDIWRSNGSHGCINLPPSIMPTIYEKIDEGMPVVVFY